MYIETPYIRNQMISMYIETPYILVFVKNMSFIPLKMFF